MSFSSFLLFGALFASAHAAAVPTAPSANCIDVDVAIIGGGSSGIYAATRLIDNNKTVVVLESEDQIGGHAQTYIDQVTGVPVNLGVVIFTNTTIISNYLARYDMPVTLYNVSALTSGSASTEYVDFATGQVVPVPASVIAQQAAAIPAALQTYAEQLAKYPYITYGYNLPDPVPEDLVMPFGQFMEKYNMTALISTVFFVNQGFVPLLDIPTLYMLKYFGPYQLQSFSEGYFLTSATGNTRTLYDNAEKELGSQVMYSVADMHVTRTEESVTIKVGQSSTGPALVRAKKLIVAIPPTLRKLHSAGIYPNAEESAIFGELHGNGYYSMILNYTGFTSALNNVDPTQPYSIPQFPAVYQAGPAVGTDNLAALTYASAHPLPIDQVTQSVISQIEALSPEIRSNVTTTPELITIVAHQPFNPMVKPELITEGYYTKLDALQGVNNTWYIGAAWATASSSTIWEGIELEFLPKFLPTLD